MKVLVIDEDKQSVERLKNYLDTLELFQFVGSTHSGVEALDLCQKLRPDIVILDVRVNGMDGFELAKRLNEHKTPRSIIITSAHENNAYSAYKIHALDFLLKPISREKLEHSLNFVAQYTFAKRIATEPGFAKSEHLYRTHISTRSHQGIKLIPIDDIYYFKAEQKYVTAVHRGGQVLVEETIRDLENQLNGPFVRIHRNTLVSKVFIDHLYRDKEGVPYIVLKEGKAKLKISRRHYSVIRNLMSL